MTKIKFHLSLLFFSLVSALTANVCNATDHTLTLSTYYPSPFGVYSQIRLYPTAFDATQGCQIGTLRVDENGEIWVCSSDGFGIGTWGDGPSVGIWEQNGDILYPTSTDTSTATMIGIGTKTPEFTLDLHNDGGIIAHGTLGVGKTLTTEGAGTRFFWYPAKSALRAGQVTGVQWDDPHVAPFSTAFGHDTVAAAPYATAIGNGSVANGHAAFAMGAGTMASGYGSFSMGEGTKNNSLGSLVIGQFNVGGGTPDAWVDTDPVFEIGNGSDNLNRSNALTVYKNGDMSISGLLGVGGIFTPDAVIHAKTHIDKDLLKLTSNNSAEIIFEPNDDITQGFRIEADQGKFSITELSTTGPGKILSITGSTGYLGLGTDTPAAKLDVAGDIYASHAGSKLIMKTSDGTCTACGPDNSDNWICASISCPVAP